jgi:hypothetical protein
MIGQELVQRAKEIMEGQMVNRLLKPEEKKSILCLFPDRGSNSGGY